MPPRVDALPVVGAAWPFLRHPTEFLRRMRFQHGDTFVVDIFGYRLFCVFSPAGVRQIYGLAESEASFGAATYELVLKHKLPVELTAGRRNFAQTLFGKQDVEDYLDTLEDVMRLQIGELGNRGTFDLFPLARRLGYRLGLACWAGPEAASRVYLDRFIPYFDRLDASDSFVRPVATLLTHWTGKRRERRAMYAIEELIGKILQERRARGARRNDFLDRIESSFADLPIADRDVMVARDIMMIQMGAQSNFHAALAWTLVYLLLDPLLLEEVRDGDDEILESCAHEAIRLSQRSLTLRQVVRPLTFEIETGKYELSPGVMIATMLSLNNRDAVAELRNFDRHHFDGGRLSVDLPVREIVSTFGHGRHSCPAQRFSISAIRIAVRRLLDSFHLAPQFVDVIPSPRQLGGIARCDEPCVVRYEKR